MQIEIRQTKEDGIVQIITLDERWYSKEAGGILVFNPSITWISIVPSMSFLHIYVCDLDFFAFVT
jgi:hypothetical protein